MLSVVINASFTEFIIILNHFKALLSVKHSYISITEMFVNNHLLVQIEKVTRVQYFSSTNGR